MKEQAVIAKGIGEAYQLLHEGILALAQAEQQGMRVSTEYIEKQKKSIDRKIKKLEGVIYDSEFFKDWQRFRKNKPINIYSPKQMGEYLYGYLKLEAKKKTKSGGDSTDEDTLSQLGIPELDTFVEIKKLKKIRDTYLSGFMEEQVNSILHAFFHLHLVRTYRGSASSPNLQNVPKRDKETMKLVRGALHPRLGHQFLELDYSQLEVRISACYNLDPTLIKYIETGHDMHKDLAEQIFKIDQYDPKLHKELRGAAKNGFVFAQFYGDYYKNCAKNIAANWLKLPEGKWKPGQGVKYGDGYISDYMISKGFTSLQKFTDHLEKIEEDFWGNRYPVYAQWKEKWWQSYLKKGYFSSKTGFIYNGIMSRNDVTNYPVQGAAFHVLLWCFIRATKVFKEKGMQTRLVCQIHDAIVLDVYPPEREQVIKIMKRIMEKDVRKAWPWIIVPLQIEAELCPVDGSWAEKQEYNIHEL